MLATKWKNSNWKGILLILVCAITASTMMCSAYPVFRQRANENIKAFQAEHEEEKSESLIYVDIDFMRYLRSSIYYMNYEVTPDMDAFDYFTQNYDLSRLTDEERNNLQEASARLMKNMRNQYAVQQSNNSYASFAIGAEKSYGSNGDLQMIAQGNSEYLEEYYAGAMVITYDSRGIPSIKNCWGLDFNQAELTGYLQQASMGKLMEDNGMQYDGDLYDGSDVYETVTVVTEDGDTYEKEIPMESNPERNAQLLASMPVPAIQNATFVFGIYGDGRSDYDYLWRDYWAERQSYVRSGYMIGVLAILFGMVLLALVLQNIPSLELRNRRIFRLPTELTAYAGAVGMAVTVSLVPSDFAIYTMTTGLLEDFQYMGFGNFAQSMTTLFIWLFWTCFALCWYWFAASVIPYIIHPIRTLRDHMLCIGICRWMKRLWLRFWHWATDVEVDENLTRNIWKVVGLNGVIVAFLCCIWLGGVVGAVVYTILLYIVIKKKCGEIQGQYRKLLDMTRTIAAGDLNTETDQDVGIFNPVRDELASIQSGFRMAVNEEVRSRNMKTELITNVSHDLKTPLTAIITYVDLLKKEGITEEERKDYIDTLDKKSQRLKVLIEDLFEVSKATTDNITMNFEDVDLVSLMKQVRLENEDRIAQSTLDFRWNFPEEKCILPLDPQRMFRVADNLVQNILKYSMPNSRVYIELKDTETEVLVSFKNMSATEMNFSPEEITERFVRGDLSRNTEGSGLGLAIAQSFTELQNGWFKVETDGDLFKVILGWKK